MNISFSELMAVVTSGVTLHNVLRLAATKFAAATTKVATDVETGNGVALVHDAKGVIDFVQTHDPALAKAVENEADRLKAAAAADVERVWHAAAEELRKLAESVEKAAGAVPATPAPSVPAVPETPPAA